MKVYSNLQTFPTPLFLWSLPWVSIWNFQMDLDTFYLKLLETLNYKSLQTRSLSRHLFRTDIVTQFLTKTLNLVSRTWSFLL